jgi:hypothetical protein
MLYPLEVEDDLDRLAQEVKEKEDVFYQSIEGLNKQLQQLEQSKGSRRHQTVARLEEIRKKKLKLFLKDVHYLGLDIDNELSFRDEEKALAWWMKTDSFKLGWRTRAYAMLFTRLLVKKITDYPSFLRFWALFFSNKIYHPGYGSLWYDEGAMQFHNDPVLMKQAGEKLAELTTRGIFTMDGQAAIADKSDRQRAYLIGFAPGNLQDNLFNTNLESGIATLVSTVDSEFRDLPIETYPHIPVTWQNDDWFTTLGIPQHDYIFEVIGAVLPPEVMQKVFYTEKWVEFQIMDTITGRDNLIQTLKKWLPKVI